LYNRPTNITTAIKEGARIIIADLKLTPEAEDFTRHHGSSKVIFVKTDVSKRAQLENLITVSEKHFGDVPDVYICGAAIFELVTLSSPLDHIFISKFPFSES
jgi:hypothetical protein